MADQLEVINKDHLHAPAPDGQAGTAADVEHREAAAVVNVEGFRGKLVGGLHDAEFRCVVEESIADNLNVGLSAAQDNATGQLVGWHLQRKIQGWDATAGHVLAGVEHPGGFAHGGTAGHDGQLARAQAAGEVVERLKAGLYAEFSPGHHELLQFLQQTGHDGRRRAHAVGALPEGKRQDGLSGVLQDVVSGLREVRGGRLQAAGSAEDCAAGVQIAEGLHMVLHCGGSTGGVRDHVRDGAGAADKLKAVVAGEDLRNGDDIWHAASRADVADDAEDRRVGGREE